MFLLLQGPIVPFHPLYGAPILPSASIRKLQISTWVSQCMATAHLTTTLAELGTCIFLSFLYFFYPFFFHYHMIILAFYMFLSYLITDPSIGWLVTAQLIELLLKHFPISTTLLSCMKLHCSYHFYTLYHSHSNVAAQSMWDHAVVRCLKSILLIGCEIMLNMMLTIHYAQWLLYVLSLY